MQIHPTGFLNPQDPGNRVKFLAPEALRGHGAIMLNQDGTRFCDELGPRDLVTDSIFKNCHNYPGTEMKTAILVLDDQALKAFGVETANFYLKKGLFQVVEGMEGIARVAGASPDKIRETLEKYRRAADGLERDTFGKTVFPSSFTGDPTSKYCKQAMLC